MAYSTKVGSFLKTGSVATQAITGVGFQPKALILFSSNQLSTGTFDPNFVLAMAISDGSTSFGRASLMNHYSAGPAAAPGPFGSTRQAAGLPFVSVNGSGAPSTLAHGAIQSLDVDGFTMNWTTNDGTSPRVFYIALGGSDLTAKVVAFTPHGRAGQQSITGMGFRPNAVLFLPGFGSTTPNNSGGSCAHSMGVALSAQEQWALCGWAKGTGSRPSYTSRYQRDDRCLVIPKDAVSTAFASVFDGTDRIMDSEAAFVSRDLDGCTIDWQVASALVPTVYCLGLKGGRYKAGSLLKLQGSQSQILSGVPFQPTFMLLAGDGRHEDVLDLSIPATEMKISLGAIDAAGNQGFVSGHDVDSAGLGAGNVMPINARYMHTTAFGRIFEADATASASLVQADATLTSFNADGATIQWANADALRRQFLYLLAAAFPTAGACAGGGAAPSTTDPSADATLTNASRPIFFVELALDGGTKRYAAVPLADPSTYFGGYKDGRLLSIGAITRSLSDINGNYQTASVSITLDDTDRAIRTLEAAGTLLNRRVDIYAVDDVDRRAGTAARRLGSFVIRQWKPDGGMTFTLDLEDWFGSQLSEFDTGKLLPQRTFSAAIFSGLPSDLVGVPEPIGYGGLSDETNGVDAVGVVPVYYTGQEVVSGFAWDRYVVFGHAIKSIQSWFASDLGQNPDGAPRRIKMPASTEGVDFLIPGNTGWNAATGSTNKYRDYSGRRYTVIFARGPRSDDHKSGAVPMALNVCGIEDVGDGSGTMIDALPSQILHALTNHVAQNYLTGGWLAVPSSNGYSQLKSVAAANTSAGARVSGGYKGAFILGGGQGQISVADLMTAACRSADVNMGINRHGQIVISMEDASVATVATLTDLLDIDDQGLAIEIGWQDLANRVPYRYGQSYVPPPSSSDTAVPWAVDTAIADGAATTAHKQTRSTDEWELALVRDSVTGDDVVAKVLARRTGGAAPYRGPIYATVAGGLNLSVADLGDNILVTHFAGLGASGWTAQKMRVMAVALDPSTCGITLTLMKV